MNSLGSLGIGSKAVEINVSFRFNSMVYFTVKHPDDCSLLHMKKKELGLTLRGGVCGWGLATTPMFCR